MTTYAHYRLWIGILSLDTQKIPKRTEQFLTRIEDASELVEEEGLIFQKILMHAELIGFGIPMEDLEWITADERPEVFNMGLCAALPNMLTITRKVFRSFGLRDAAKLVNIYHHLDLRV